MEHPHPYNDEKIIKEKDPAFFYNAVSIKKTKQEVSTDLASDPKSWPCYESFTQKTKDLESYGVQKISPECTLSFLSTFFNLVKTNQVDPGKIFSKKMYEEINEPFKIVSILNASGFKPFFQSIEGPASQIECFEGRLEQSSQDKCLWTRKTISSQSSFFVYSIISEGSDAPLFFPIIYSSKPEKELRMSVINSIIFSFKIEEYILSEIGRSAKKDSILTTDTFACELFYNICTFNTILKKAFKDF